ncbi:hypothetical protein PFTANZ_00976 [Plasmodium falciparum Tanzania (2000708)]|uniref:Uncharacterized protein n=3 Tax=Plasmodium falciparum TaxID=5833 RepID=A0A024WCR7_PLAFA|nr:hypothetical protein PFTANZ_00976 [Plasmodium falciparum Tanzania (2000708)]
MGIGIISGISKSLHFIVATPSVCAKSISIKDSCASKAAQIAQAYYLKAASKLTAINTTCEVPLASPDVDTIVVTSIIIIILVIVLIIFIYFLIKKSEILENERVQKVITPIELFLKKKKKIK